jgi:hypothetical protein
MRPHDPEDPSVELDRHLLVLAALQRLETALRRTERHLDHVVAELSRGDDRPAVRPDRGAGGSS